MARQWDSGTADIASNKNAQSQLFNVTFPTIPEVFVTLGGGSLKGTGASNITTTGFDIFGESAELVHWVARETGYEEASPQLPPVLFLGLIAA